MNHGPVRPATLELDAGGRLVAPAFRDRVDPSRVDDFLEGTGLPGRWQGRARFVVLATGFGTGAAFLRTWHAWRADPARCERLVYLAIEPQPLAAADLRRLHAGTLDDAARALLVAWPALTPDLHRLTFDAARVQLLIAFGPLAQWLPQWVAEVDAFYLDDMGGAPQAEADNSHDVDRQCKALGRLAAVGAALAAPHADAGFAAPLRSAGFVTELAEPAVLRARFAPRFTPRRAPCSNLARPAERHAVIVGAGLAGCAAACALAEQGWHSTLLERHDRIAAEASGNPAGLFHGIVNAQDGAHARFGRAAALAVAGDVAEALAHGVAGARGGFLRLEKSLDADGMRARLDRLGLPPDYVQALDATAASACVGVPLPWPCWFYPTGGWLAPAGLAGDFLRRAQPRVEMRTGAEVHSLTAVSGGWQLRDRAGLLVAETPTVVLANGFEALRLLGEADWPVRMIRGQISRVRHAPFRVPALPMAGDGYLLPDPYGGALFGATAQPQDADPSVRDADHAYNLDQLARLLGHPICLAVSELEGRTGWRCSATDRLPLIGAAPDTSAARQRRDQVRLVPRRPGLFVFTGLGSRGITWSTLGSQVLAAWVTGAPMPVPASLRDAIDPARFARST